jgi:hypothetical protein
VIIGSGESDGFDALVDEILAALLPCAKHGEVGFLGLTVGVEPVLGGGEVEEGV